MKRQQTLTPSKLTLLMLGVGTVALMGVPGFGHYFPPEGAVTGTVMDARGFGLDDIEVALFNEHELSLVALTRTDTHGRFAFHQVPPRFHVFAHPVGAEALVGSWVLNSERAPVNHVELTLRTGHPLSVVVKNEEGIAVSSAELRVYAADKATVAVHRVATDLQGGATVIAPRRAHIAVLGHEGLAPIWLFDQEIPEKGRTLAVTLKRARPVEGRVVNDRGEALANIVVSGWEFEGSERWTGYAVTDDDGWFRLATHSGEAFVRAVDPLRRHLPTVEAIASGTETELATLVLGTGHPLEVRTRSESESVPTRVWVWSEAAGAWAWGASTNADGVLATVVSTVHGIVTDPLDTAFAGTEAWSVTYQGPSRQISVRRVETTPPPTLPDSN